jgi:hypothetical protein
MAERFEEILEHHRDQRLVSTIRMDLFPGMDET